MSDLEGVDVIDWDEAMQQCGDDEEFLLELLGDLRDETDSQMATMEEIIEVRSAVSSQERRDWVFVAIVGFLWIRSNGLHLQFGFGPSHRHWKHLFSLSFLFVAIRGGYFNCATGVCQPPILLKTNDLPIDWQNPLPADKPFLGFVRAAHVIKGAASNLMCEQLRKTAMDLETTATNANAQQKKDKEKKDDIETVKKKLDALKVAVSNYHEYLEDLDI